MTTYTHYLFVAIGLSCLGFGVQSSDETLRQIAQAKIQAHIFLKNDVKLTILDVTGRT